MAGAREPANIRPIFVYGTLMAAPLLAWVLTGDASKTDEVLAQRKLGRITGFSRHIVLGSDYPALLPTSDTEAAVEGFVVFPRNISERSKLDTFEGDAYIRTPVAVDVGGETVEADTYVWMKDRSELGDEDWNFTFFESERLDDWLELFRGMELIA